MVYLVTLPQSAKSCHLRPADATGYDGLTWLTSAFLWVHTLVSSHEQQRSPIATSCVDRMLGHLEPAEAASGPIDPRKPRVITLNRHMTRGLQSSHVITLTISGHMSKAANAAAATDSHRHLQYHVWTLENWSRPN